DYEEAARICDSLRSFEEDMLLLHLWRLMKEAVADQNYFEVNSEKSGYFGWKMSKVMCYGTALAVPLKFSSNSVEQEEWESGSKSGVSTMKAEVSRPVQLLRTYLIITDARGKPRFFLFQRIGVIGEQPVILPKSGFEYSSACPLSTPNGRMSLYAVLSITINPLFDFSASQEGDFEMKHIDRVGSQTFNVAIAPFSFSIVGDDSDTF
ncbi:ApaG domain, partial [Dillenia turbinata]